jgi:uncharacterized protein YeaC (DUF1315 family)
VVETRTRVDVLDRTVARMVRILELGKWPSGLELTPTDRELVEWNLELVRRERAERRARRP